MRNLAIECSGLSASAGVFEDERAIATTRIASDAGSVRHLAEEIQRILQSAGPVSQQRPVDWIGVSVGPGSFTGLRVGLTTAKLLAYAWKVRVVGVDSLQALAYQAWCTEARNSEQPCNVVPVVNAFRQQVFCGIWQFHRSESETHIEALEASSVLDASQWIADPTCGHQEAESQFLLTGPGLEKYTPKTMPANVRLADRSIWEPGVESVAFLARRKQQRGATSTAIDLLPNYVRASAAEEAAKP